MAGKNNKRNSRNRARSVNYSAYYSDDDSKIFEPTLELTNIMKSIELINESIKDINSKLITLDDLNKVVDKVKMQFNNALEEHKKDIGEKIKNMECKYENLLKESTKTCSDLTKERDEARKKNIELENELINKTEEFKKQIVRIDTLDRGKIKNEAEQLSMSVILSSNNATIKLPIYNENEDLQLIAIDILKRASKLEVKKADIVAARRMGRAPPPNGHEDRRSIIVTFANMELKKNLQYALFQMRETSAKGVFINELLLKDVNNLYYKIRKIKKENSSKIKSVYTTRGAIKVKVQNQNQNSKPIEILTQKDFLDCLKLLGIENQNYND